MKIKKMITSSVGKLMMGSFIGQLITILVSPLTTRLYSAKELGVYTLLLTIVNMVGPVVCGKYEMAIVTETDEKKVPTLIVLSMIVNFIVSTIAIILYIIYLIIVQKFHSVYIIYMIIIYIVLILNGISNVLVFYNNRNKDYGIISKVYIIRTGVQNLLLIVLGLLKCSVLGLLISQLLSMFVGIRKQAEKLIPNLNLLKKVTKKDIMKLARSNKKLPLYTAPSNLVSLASYSILNFFITMLYGTVTFGYYSMSYRMLGLPLTLVSRNVSQVFFRNASNEYEKNGSYRKNLLKTSGGLLLVSIAMVSLLFLLAPWAFEIFFGAKWRVSGEYVQILVLMFGIRFIVAALTPALVIIKRQDIELKVQIMFIVSALIVFVVSKIYKINIEKFLVLITIIYSVIYIFMYTVIYRKSVKRSDVV